MNIVQSFGREELLFQIHHMQDDTTHIFWRKSLELGTFLTIVKGCAQQANVNATFSTLVNIPGLLDQVDTLCPIQSCKADPETLAILRTIINTTFPIDIKKILGMDGHNFEFIIYSNPHQTLSCSSFFPREWSALKPLISKLVTLAQLDPLYYGYYDLD